MERTTGKSIFLLCNLYVSAVVGAGFATGQEIMGFFTRYGPAGFWGVLVSAAAFMIMGPLLLQKAIRCDAYTPGELASFRFGRKGEWVMRTINLFLEFSVLIVMLSGLRTVLHQAGIPDEIAIVLLTAGIFVIISSDMKRVLRFNGIITPVVIIGITAACVLLLTRCTDWSAWTGTEEQTPYPWLVSALLYAGFNLLLAMPALCLAGKMIQREDAAAGGGLLGGFCIGAMAMLSNSLIFVSGPQLASAQMPVVELALASMPWFGTMYQVVIFAAMAGSAVICARCAVDLFPAGKTEKRWLRSALVCCLAGPLSMLDFSGLIGILYPFFGGVGILAVLLILW